MSNANTAAMPALSRKIMIVDDNVDAAEGLKALLELDGHQVVLAADGLQALHLASTFAPDAFVIDIGLPDMSGHGLAAELRHQAAGMRARMVAVTGYGQPDDIERSLAAGFDAHLVKPVQYDAIAAFLAAHQP